MTILDEIVEYKRKLLNTGYYKEKLASLEQSNHLPSQTLLSQLENQDVVSVIAEIKSKSPSVPELPHRDLEKQIKAYEANGANAVSILTDEDYFGGSFERLQTLAQYTQLPILCKDFIIDPIQIDVAKRAGASIILLIVNILDDETLASLYQYTINQGLEVLVEVHDQPELARAYKIEPKIIGINNRDLKHFITDVNHTNEILKAKRSGYHYISESGIHTKADVEKIIESGISGVLVGEALMKCDRLDHFLPQLKLEKVKV